MGLSPIFLHHFSCSLRAISLVPRLSSLCFEDFELELWLDLRSCLPDPWSEWPELLECDLLWASEWYQELSRRGRSSLAESSYLLQAARPRLSKSSGFGKFRQTDFTADFNFGGGVGVSGSLMQVEIGPCWTAGLQLWKRPRRVWHHWNGHTLAQLLPTGGSYSFSFSPPMAIPNTWLLCLGQGNPGRTPSGLQVGAGWFQQTGWPVNTWPIPLLSAPSVVPGVGPAQSGVWPRPFWNTGWGWPVPPPKGFGALSGWQTSAVRLGLTGSCIPGSAFVSPVPPVWWTAGLNPEGEWVPPCGYLARLMLRRPLHPVPGRQWPILPEWFRLPGCQYWCHLCYHCILENVSLEGSRPGVHSGPSTNSSYGRYSLNWGSASTSSSG